MKYMLFHYFLHYMYYMMNDMVDLLVVVDYVLFLHNI